MEIVTQAKAALLRLDAYMSESNYAGPDPYDGLRSPLARFAPGKLGKQILIQGVKRSPVELRPVLGITPVRMAKTLGLISSSLESAQWLPDAVERRFDLTRELAAGPNMDGGWGYEFDVQMRWGSYKAGTSNIIATTFVVDALRDAVLAQHQSSWKESVATWITERLGQEGFISYVANNPSLIHNANVLGAMSLSRCDNSEPLIMNALEKTLLAQRADGAWSYGTMAHISWIDSFHTAYVLWGLYELRERDVAIADAFQKGLDFWLANCFTTSGEPKYYATDARSTKDVHTWATAIFLLAHIQATEETRERAVGLVKLLLDRIGQESVITTRRSGRPYVRWELAHLHRALSEFTREF